MKFIGCIYVFDFLLIGRPSPSFASSERRSPRHDSCDDRFTNQLARTPDDDNNGLVSSQVKMSLDTLLSAYSEGIFPWDTDDNGNLSWHNPPDRGVMDLSKLKISDRDMKYIRSMLNNPEYEFTIDKAFREVIEECADMVRWKRDANGNLIYDINRNRVRDQRWITDDFINNYVRLFETEHAHSFEAWHNGILVGGFYITYINGVPAGESMFHKEANVIKPLYYLFLKRMLDRGHQIVDTQQAKPNSLAKKWGAEWIPRSAFMHILRVEQAKALPF
jgi:leucyl/phenylalanyl-tRNA---protein transferase